MSLIGKFIVVATLFVLAESAVLPDPAHAQAEERPVTYSTAQSDAGRRAYTRYCAMCHGDNLDDGEFGGPPLTGLRFQQTFGEAPVSALYQYIGATMPPDRPGRLSDKARLDVIAYLLNRNGYASGAPLPATVEEMDFLIVRK
jgi:mono/diheme cytochrome c family protein